MTDTQGDRPDQSGESAAAPQTPPPSQPAAGPQASAAATNPFTAPHGTPPQHAAAAPQHPGAGQQPQHPATGQQQPYPTPPRSTGAYPAYPTWSAPPSHPGNGQAFGAAAQQTQPTVPLAHTGAVATDTEPRKKTAAGRVAGLLVAAALVGGAAGLGGSYAGTALWGPVGESTAVGPSVVTVNDDGSVNNTTAVAAKVTPSVVTISARSGSSGGTGSGVIISSDGYVLTNTHVVTLDGATADPEISVTTADGKVYSATIVGTDPTYDLAVIQLEDASGLTAIEWGDSGDLNVGDETIAVGAPLGLSNTVTTGIVSALNRSIEIASSAAPDSSDSDSDSDEPDQQGEGGPFQFDFGQGQTQAPSETIKIAVIQTDASINPGNSGGALVNAQGELIGINVAIASTGGSAGQQAGSIGVGFSIPSDVAERIADEIIADGSATHGLLGASVQDAGTVEGSTITGAYIAEATAGGAAAAAGLQAGDTVTAFNGVPITDSVDLTAQVRAAAAGSDAEVTFVRDGETRTLDVTLGTLE